MANYQDRLDRRWNISTAAQYNNSYYFVWNYNYLYLYCLIRILSPTFGSYSLRTIERRRLWGAYLYLIVMPVLPVGHLISRVCYSVPCWSSYRPTNIMYVVYTHTSTSPCEYIIAVREGVWETANVYYTQNMILCIVRIVYIIILLLIIIIVGLDYFVVGQTEWEHNA